MVSGWIQFGTLELPYFERGHVIAALHEVPPELCQWRLQLRVRLPARQREKSLYNLIMATRRSPWSNKMPWSHEMAYSQSPMVHLVWWLWCIAITCLDDIISPLTNEEKKKKKIKCCFFLLSYFNVPKRNPWTSSTSSSRFGSAFVSRTKQQQQQHSSWIKISR